MLSVATQGPFPVLKALRVEESIFVCSRVVFTKEPTREAVGGISA